MDTRYEAYCFTDPVFYDSPGGSGGDFLATLRPAPAGWQTAHRDSWVMLYPAGHTLPAQGWKVHVSSTAADAGAVAGQVRDWCLAAGVPVKFLRNRAAFLAANAKYAARGSSGKLATVYPSGDGELHRVLVELGGLLAGRPGPYILSDLRWADGPLYVRYGAFVERYVAGADGEPVPALEGPDGGLVPDRRTPTFHPPAWAPLPAFLLPALAARNAQTVTGLPFTIDSALHFSNAGGVYAGTHLAGGRAVVVKEARPHAGLDQHGTDAVSRLLRERAMLAELAGVPGVPELIDHVVCGGHHFLVQERVPGEPLSQLMAQRHPLIQALPGAADVAAYRDWALAVAAAVAGVLDRIHARGVVFGDLHPGNVLVAEDGTVHLIDFELASFAAEGLRPGLGAPGYAAPADRAGVDIDRYALACLRLALFLPLTAASSLDASLPGRLAAAATERFGLPASFAPSIVDTLGAAPVPPGVRPLAGPVPDWPAARGSMARAILASATPERLDRLYPGDIGQFQHNGLGLAYGAAGVLFALAAAGGPVPEDGLDWLVTAVRERPVRQVGLYDGLHGIGYVLGLLGRTADAAWVLDRALSAAPFAAGRTAVADGVADPVADPVGDGAGRDLFGGAAGVGLGLLHAGLPGAALAVADRLAEVPAGMLAEVPRPGLLHGRSGEALLFLALYEHGGDPALLDAAAAALRADLDRCLSIVDGSLQVDDRWRTLPYLATGSAGIGLVLHRYLGHRGDERFAAALADIQRAALPELTVHSGLFNGRAGLLAMLAATGGDPAAIRRHLRRLGWHAVDHQGHLAFPGDQLVRLSMDLATGSAGVLLALSAAMDARPQFLPFLLAPAAPLLAAS